MSEKETTKFTLYAGPNQKVFYWIPNDLEIAEGSLEISTIRREKRMVEPEAVTAFIIDEAQAKVLAKQAVANVTNVATRFISRTAVAMRELQETQARVEGDKKATSESPADRLAATLGITDEQLRNDPEAVKQGMMNVFEGLKTALGAAATPVMERTADQEERLKSVKKYAVEELGADIGEQVGEWPEQIAESLANPELVEKAKESAAYMRQLAAEIRAGAVRAEEVLSEE